MSISELIVLGFLKIKPMHGYEIVNFAKTRGLDVWAGVKMPSVYNALKRLDKKELIRGERIEENNNPPRIVYTILESGKEYLREILLKAFKKKHLLAQDFWMYLSFAAGNIGKDNLLKIINKRIVSIEEHMPSHNSIRDKLKGNVQYEHVPFYMATLVEMGGEIHNIELKKLNEIKDELLTGNHDHLFINEEE